MLPLSQNEALDNGRIRALINHIKCSKKGHLKSSNSSGLSISLPPQRLFYFYLQLRRFYQNRYWENISNLSSIEEILIKIQQGSKSPKAVSIFYKKLSDSNTNNTTPIKRRWGWDKQYLRRTRPGLWREFKWKVVSRFFRTPKISSKYNPGNPDTCWRTCATNLGTHIFVISNNETNSGIMYSGILLILLPYNKKKCNE